MILDNCDFNDDFTFSKSTIPAWIEFLKDYFGPDLYDVIVRDDGKSQSNYWDLLLLFSGDKPPKRIEVKSRRCNAHVFYLKYHDRILETQGNEQLNKEGSSIHNTKADYFGTGFFNGKEMIDVLIFDPKPVSDKIKELLAEGKLEEIPNKKTNGLYNSKYVKLLEKYILPHKVLPSKTGLEEFL